MRKEKGRRENLLLRLLRLKMERTFHLNLKDKMRRTVDKVIS